MNTGESSYRRFQNGDPSGFIEIIEQYRENLIFFINGYVGNISVAEDIAEDTFCDLIIYKNRYRGGSSFKTYIFAIAKNKALTYVKKSSHLDHAPIEDRERELSDLRSLEDDVIKDEEKKMLYDAISRLKSDYKAVLHLLYFEDMPRKEAAAVLGKTVKQIDNLALRAKQALKAELKKENFVYEIE